VGEISTKSNSESKAICFASRLDKMPNCCPSAPISLTCGQLISSFRRGSFLSFAVIPYSSKKELCIGDPSCSFIDELVFDIGQRKTAKIVAVLCTQCDGLRLNFLVADNEKVGHPMH